MVVKKKETDDVQVCKWDINKNVVYQCEWIRNIFCLVMHAWSWFNNFCNLTLHTNLKVQFYIISLSNKTFINFYFKIQSRCRDHAWACVIHWQHKHYFIIAELFKSIASKSRMDRKFSPWNLLLEANDLRILPITTLRNFHESSVSTRKFHGEYWNETSVSATVESFIKTSSKLRMS